MGKLTGYEKIALGLTALFLVVCAWMFCLGNRGEAYTITVSDRSPEAAFGSDIISNDGVPDSLIPGEKIDVNTAPAADLARLPGIGAAKAEAIVDYREENGFFRSPQDLLPVPGIGEGILEKIQPYIEFG